MKTKLLLLTLFLCINTLYAQTDLENYRWRNDDGNESTATWRASLNSPTQLNSYDEVLRLRMHLENVGGIFSYDNITGGLLQYSKDNGSWINITTNQGSGDFYFFDSNHITHNSIAYSRISSSGSDFQNGRVVEMETGVSTISLDENEYTEFEYAFAPTVTYDASSTYRFRINDSEVSYPIYPVLDPNSNYCSPVSIPTVSTPVVYNVGDTAISLTATTGDTGLMWYTTPTGGTGTTTAPTPSTATIGDTWYFVSSTNAIGCESDRVGILVSVVNPIPANHISFDGVDDQVNIGNGLSTMLNSLNTITVEAWVKPTDNSGTEAIFSNYSYPTDNGQMQLLLRKQNDNYVFFVDDGSGFNSVSTNSTVAVNTWQHIAATWDGDALRIYVDGVLQATTTNVTGSSFNTSVSNDFAIGYSFAGGGEIFEGSIDELRVWNTALTETQINARKDCELLGSETGLITYYNFNQGVDTADNTAITTLLDSSTNTNNGALTNFTLTGATSNWLAGSPLTTGTIVPSAPIVTTPVVYNQGNTASPLTATTGANGSGLLWYTTATGGTGTTTAPTPSTATVGSTTYWVSSSNANGCESDRVAIIVTINSAIITATYSQNNVSCNGGSNGSITVTASGGTPPYNYLWNNGETTSTINNLSAGTYVLYEIVDSLGLSTGATSYPYLTVTITQPGEIIVSASETNVSSCGLNDGSATLIVIGGTPPYTYNWSNTDNLATTNALSPGDYTCIITDANGCVAASPLVTITEPALATPTIASPVFYGLNDTATALTAISAGDDLLWYTTATGGTGSTTAPTPDTTAVGSTSYWVSSTNTFGCESDREEIVVNVIVTPVPTTSWQTQIYTGDDKTLANLEVTGTAIQWYDAATGGNLLAITTLLVDETTYYATQTVSTIESTERLAITTKRISDNLQSLAFGSTVADLVTTPNTGATAQWFTTATGGTALDGTTPLTNGTYYVEQFSPESSTILANFSDYANDIAIQPDGKILVANSDNTIKRMDADGTNIEILASGFNIPYGVAIQSDGKILVADTYNNAIKRMDADGTNIETLGSGFNQPLRVAVQSDGKILVTDFGNGVVKRMDADGSNIETLGSGFSLPAALALQSDGKILVGDIGTSDIKRMDTDGLNIESLGDQLISPWDIAVQSDGKIKMLQNGHNYVYQMNADGSNVEAVGTGFSSADCLAIQPDGSILIGIVYTLTRMSFETISNRIPVMIDATLSASDFDTVDFTVYPNPTIGTLHIQINNIANATAVVYDIMGRTVLSKKVNATDILNVSNLNSGVYVLQITTKNGTVSKRIIKK